MKYKDCIRMVEWNTGIKLHLYQKLLLKYLIENKAEGFKMDTSERDKLIQAVKEGRLPSLGIHTSPNGLNDSQTNDSNKGF